MLFVVNLLLKISNYLGIDPKILFYIWQPVTYLLQHIIHLLLVIIISVLILIFLRKSKSRKRKIVLNKKLYIIVLLLIGYLIFLIISICTYKPYNDLKLKDNEINILVFPIFNLGQGSYLSINNDSIYFQETFVDYLTRNKPEIAEITGRTNFNPVSVPVQYIPFFIYKPSTFDDFIKKINYYTFAIWGYKIDNRFETIKINLNRSLQINPEYDYKGTEKISDMMCVIFNELDSVPYKTKIDFFSLLVSGIIEQSSTTLLTNSYDSEKCDVARKQLDSSLKKIDESFSSIIKKVPQNKHKIIKYYYSQYIELFIKVKKIINAPDSCPEYKKFYNRLLENLYAPHNNEYDYFSWLSNHWNVNSASRLIPLFVWPAYDSEFEKFVDYLLNYRYVTITNEQIKEIFNNLRKKHGDKFIINYYETIVLYCRHDEDREYIKKLLQTQKKLNIYDKDLTLRQIDIIND